MAVVMELDPIFIKALRLLHSRSKDSTEQLKQLAEEAIDKAKGEDAEKKEDGGLLKSSSSRKDRETGDVKRRESEKRHIEKLQQDLADLCGEVTTKKPRLELAGSEGSTTTGKEKDADRSRDREREREWDKERERYKDKTARDRERERARDREGKERMRDELKEEEEEDDGEEDQWDQMKSLKAGTVSSDTDASESEDMIVQEQNEDHGKEMDMDDFALFQGIACVVCKQFEVGTGNQLVECQECHSLYHQECHKPPVIENNVNDPRFVWYCSKCMKNLKKTVAAKVPKSKSSSHGQGSTASRETVTSRGARTESTSMLQPFRRLEPSKPSASKEGSNGSTGRPLMGLAGLAANLSGKEKHLKTLGHKSPGSGSSTSASRLDPAPGKVSLLKQDIFKGGAKEPGRSATGSSKDTKSGLGLSALARPDVAKSGSSSSKGAKSGQSLLTKAMPISSSSAFAQSSFGAALTSGLSKSPSSSSLKSAGSAGSSSKDSSGGKMPQSSMMHADKRLQMMKKKAQAKHYEKRSLPK